jgi:hypothetical protein
MSFRLHRGTLERKSIVSQTFYGAKTTDEPIFEPPRRASCRAVFPAATALLSRIAQADDKTCPIPETDPIPCPRSPTSRTPWNRSLTARRWRPTTISTTRTYVKNLNDAVAKAPGLAS